MEASGEHGTVSDSVGPFLLGLARRTITSRLLGGVEPSPVPDEPVLQEDRGAFVTLTSDGVLRGCIGHVVGVMPLWRAVMENAEAAAFRDPRFLPVTREELSGIRIEVSVLTPLIRCEPGEIQVGRDGIVIERGPSRGLLLPQVAVEYGWDREAFLDHTCRKAGLEIGCWRDPVTVISRFSAKVFSEPLGSPSQEG